MYPMTTKKAKKGKYYISAVVSDMRVTAFCDTGADLSICGYRYKALGSVYDMDEPIKVRSYDDKSKQTINQYVMLNVEFYPIKTVIKFYLADVHDLIIGIDIMRNFPPQISLNTKNEMFYVGEIGLKTSPTIDLSLQQLDKRMSDYFSGERKIYINNWVRLRNDVEIMPYKTQKVGVKMDKKPVVGKHYVFLSLHDNGENSMMIPSFVINDQIEHMKIPIENWSGSILKLSKNVPIGELKVNGDTLDETTVMAFSSDDISLALEELGNEISTISANDLIEVNDDESHRKRQKDPNSDEDQCEKNEDSKDGESRRKEQNGEKTSETKMNETEPVKFTDIMEKNKVTSDTLIDIYKRGIEMDLKSEAVNVEVDIDELPIDNNEEAMKSKTCEYWPDNSEFVKLFDLSSVADDMKRDVEKLLISYKHIFFNENCPGQFHEGVRVKPIKIGIKPNAPPPKRLGNRRLSQEKMEYLKAHVKTMLERKIIEEMGDDEGEGGYYSAMNIIHEVRYQGHLRANVVKQRAVYDLRMVNNLCYDLQYPLPLCSEFRSFLASKFNSIFSNVDCVLFFYQFRIDHDSAKLLFNFIANGRRYRMIRVPMGYKNSVQITMSIVNRLFSKIRSCMPYLDDLSIASTDAKTHLERDLPDVFSVCSKYNLLINPKKCDLFRTDVRVLGYQISRSSEMIADEKREKIKNLTFPKDKKEAVSRAAFFSYFLPTAPRLSEFMSPLRKLAHPKTKFMPTDKDRDDFEKLRSYLLDPDVGALRIMDADINTLTILFTDASSTQLSSCLVQLLPPLPNSNLDPTKKYLYLVGCWSRKIDDSWANYPIYLLELLALEESCKRWSFILLNRFFFIITDNSTIRNWCSLEAIPKDLARRIFRLQDYNFKIIFTESRLQMADSFCRYELDSPPDSRFFRFMENKILSSLGRPIPWEKLFSRSAANEAEKFFTKTRRQALSHAVSPTKNVVEQCGNERGKVREIMKALTSPIIDEAKNASIDTDWDPPKISAIDQFQISAFGLTDDEVDEGACEILTDVLDDDIYKEKTLPHYKGEQLKGVIKLQENDGVIDKIKDVIKNDKPSPDKIEAFLESKEMQHFYKNRSLFRLSEQDILFRVWHQADGQTDILLMVGESQFDQLIKDVHTRIESPHMHAGQRRTFLAIHRKYFYFSMRSKIARIIKACEICVMNNHTRGWGTKLGEQIVAENNDQGSIDAVGPLHGFCKTAAGNPRYIISYIDHKSRFMINYVATSVDDNNITKAILNIRDILCGFPNHIMMDNAICKENSAALKLLKDHGVRVSHGMAGISRNQSKIERGLNSLIRLICKMQTQDPKTSFLRLVANATLVLNSLPVSHSLKSPKESHFHRPPSDFLRHEPETGGRTDGDAISAARRASELTLVADVQRHLKKRVKISPTDYTRMVKIGELVLRKRTSFPKSSPKKLCYKVIFEPFKVINKVASNSYRCKSLINQTEIIIPGDGIVKLGKMSEQEAILLCAKMESRAAAEAASNVTPRVTRQSTRGARITNDEEDETSQR